MEAISPEQVFAAVEKLVDGEMWMVDGERARSS
jgi:hypothetical protein